ncbi:Rv3235 family protein [Streptacidiphilus albus]|uniref:Rv3235 family protein n=1 Tax=Streptacidiphilus albus TaxID=105425 RepID=UPI00054C6798|nr:Rv3235 family protein [Streptacidiphilus albus]
MVETELQQQPTVRRLHPPQAPRPPHPSATGAAEAPGGAPSGAPGGVRLGRLHGVGAQRHRHCGPAPTRTDGNGLAGRYAQRLLEVLSGHRVCEQLIALTTEEVYDDIRTLVRRRCLLGPGNALPLLGRVFDDSPAPGVLEVTAMVRIGERLELLAFRLELRQSRRQPTATWRFTALETRW